MTDVPDRLFIRVPEPHRAMLEHAAATRGQTISEWCRQAHRTAAKLDGIDPNTFRGRTND